MRRKLLVLSSVFAASLLVGAVVAVSVSYVAADRLVHPPREASSREPGALGIAFEAIHFASTDGVPLAGWWMPVANPSGTVVFLHGYGASKAQSLSVAPFLVAAHYNVLAFDMRGHGDSGGDHTTFGIDEVDDVAGAVAWLRGRADVDSSRIVLFGWSMGAATALNAAPGLPEVRAIVADSSFARLGDLVARGLSGMTGLPAFPFDSLTVAWASWLAKKDLRDDEPARAALGLHRPLLLIQGMDDPLARPEDAETLRASTGDNARLWLVPGATHVDAVHFRPADYQALVLAFLADALGLQESSSRAQPGAGS